MTVDETEALARAIVDACASPGARDVAQIVRGTSAVTIHFPDLPVELCYHANDFFAQVSLAKSMVASLTSQVRASAMLAAAAQRDENPLWMLSGSRFVAEWIRWTGSARRIKHVSRWAENLASWPQLPTQVDFGVTHADRHMAYAATLYFGELTGVLQLSSKASGRMSVRPTPSIKIDAVALPETVIDALLKQETEGVNSGRRLSEIVSHPFFDVYDPVVAGVANQQGTLVIEIEDVTATFDPVPAAAMAILPPATDSASPWAVTEFEKDRLRFLNPLDFAADPNR